MTEPLILPPIPPQPTTEAAWPRYLDILRLHVSAASSDAIDRQTAQMVLMTAAAQNNAALMQQLLDQPAPAPSPVGGGGGARVAMAALMTEGGSDRPPADVAQAVLARVAAVDTMLGSEAP